MYWTAGNISRTVTATPGDTATVGTFTLTADTGRYFNNAMAPVTSYVYRGSSTQRGTSGNWDVSVSSYTYSGSVGGDTNKPTSLSITLEDIDFADASAISAGTTQDTYISIGGASTVAISTATCDAYLVQNTTMSQIFSGYSFENCAGDPTTGSPIGAGVSRTEMGDNFSSLNTGISINPI